MVSAPDRGDELWYDTLVFLGTVLVAFGLGWRLDLWLANDAYMAPVFYTVILAVVFWKWVYAAHT